MKACAFNAVLVGGGGALFFPELCHGCGNCVAVCPDDALVERTRPIGLVRAGSAGRVRFLSGTLNVGEPRAAPLISALWSRIDQIEGSVIVDCPPGTSCAAMAAVRSADLVLLVAEPTPFGEHDLELSLQMCRALGRPVAVVINRSDLGGFALRPLLQRYAAAVVAQMPFCTEVAAANADGRMLADPSVQLRRVLEELADALSSGAFCEAVPEPRARPAVDRDASREAPAGQDCQVSDGSL